MSRKPAKKTVAKKAAKPAAKKAITKATVKPVAKPMTKPAAKSTAPVKPLIGKAAEGTAQPKQPVASTTKRSFPKKRIIGYTLAGLLLVVLGYLIFSFTQYTRSPAFTLQQALYAAQHQDVGAFDKHVDTTRLSAYLVDDLLTQPEIPTLPQGSGRTQNELLNLLKPGLSKTVEGQMLTLVEKGIDTAEEGNLLAAMVGKIWNAETSLAGIKTLTEDETNAVVELSLFRADFDNTLVVNVRLVKTDGKWEVVAADNLNDVMQQLDRFETLRRDAANKEVADKINAILSVRDFQKGEVLANNALVLRLSFENTGAQPVTGFAAAVALFDSNRTVLGQFNVTSDKSVAPGSFVEQSWSFKLDSNNADHAALLATPNDKLGHQVEVYSLTLADGTTLVYEK